MLKIICVLATIFRPETQISEFQPQFLSTQPKILFNSSLAPEFWGSYQPKFEISLPAKNIFLHLWLVAFRNYKKYYVDNAINRMK